MAITLGLVEAIDSNGVYVSMPGSRGVLRGPYLTLQDVAVGDRVLTVTTDDGETVIVGLASAAAPRSTPATSTDNTVPRFDGTGGAVQDSGVAIADNNTVSGVNNLYFAGTLFGDGGAASSMLVANANAGVSTDVRLRSGGNERWIIQKTNEAESGSNAGSNFRLYRRADNGSGLSYPITINRATGKITFGDVGSAAGLEMGASGPTITTGTGAPSHSAPNGSIYLRTDGTASTTLYVRAAGAWTALS